MKTHEGERLGRWVRRFLLEHLVVERNLSRKVRASRDGTRVSPALVTRPEDSACGSCASLADPGSRLRSPAPAPVAHTAVPRPTPSSTPASIQSP